MADKLHLCLGKRDDINIKSLAEIFFSSKNRARKFAMRRASKILMPAFLRLQNAQIAECSCGGQLVRAVIWQSFLCLLQHQI